MNHIDAFRRGIAAVLVVSMFALAVAPASAGQQQGTGKALVAPGAAASVDGGVLLSKQSGSGEGSSEEIGSGKSLALASEVVASQSEGSGKALVSPSEVVAARSEGSGEAPPALTAEGVLLAKGGGTGEAPPSLAEGVLLAKGGGTGEAPPSLAPGDVLFGQGEGSGEAPPSLVAVGIDDADGTNAALAPA